MKPFTVTGTGHCGTGWASVLFTRLGYDCGHERWYNLNAWEGQKTPDSSWMAMRRLYKSPGPVLNLVRNPLDVVRSFLRSGTYRDVKTPCPFTRYTYAYLEELSRAETELDRCILRTTRWDAGIQDWARYTLRIEDADPNNPKKASEAVEVMTGEKPDQGLLTGVLRELGTRYNSHFPQAPCGLGWGGMLRSVPMQGSLGSVRGAMGIRFGSGSRGSAGGTVPLRRRASPLCV